MNKKASGIAFFVLGLCLMIAAGGRIFASIPGIVFMIIGLHYMLIVNTKATFKN